MNNLTTAQLQLRLSESIDILTWRMLGLITRDGQGPLVLTEKFDRLKCASEKWDNGSTLTGDELALITECRNIVPRK